MLPKFYRIYGFRQVTDLKNYLATEKVNIVSVLTTNGEFVLYGNKKTPMMWKLWIITEQFYNGKYIREFDNG